jgi:hypothetical protein
MINGFIFNLKSSVNSKTFENATFFVYGFAPVGI